MSNKHDANVRKSTFLNFQIGLIASLLFVYVMFEVYTAKPVIKERVDYGDLYEETVFTMGDIIVEKVPVKKVEVRSKPQKVVDVSKAKVIDDDTAKEIEEYVNKAPVEEEVKPGDIVEIPEEPVIEKVPFSAVEFAPVYPGCEILVTNEERAACFSEKISKLVSRKFNGDLGEKYGLSGIQKIYVQFEVGADGEIRNIKARAPHKALAEEAKRVAGLLPKMKPGMQRDIPVKVVYNLPITFRVQD
ncbi:energy transducer TonB [Aquimarina hainanensis]|uniref:Energy transducer TonB n=1 Tax=Aquimarina hainanensis TaxID=1578017 RepID=A0ABW5N5B5_9FLAO|nr:energy transducer TonB [Aquimarina sp. TRL1]QKX05157.1 energy transducer TonB [Aquimarina sp. TRL1]